MMLQRVRFLCLLRKCFLKGATGSSSSLGVCFPSTFFILLLQEKNIDYFILLPEQLYVSFSVVGFKVVFCFYQLKE